jgi:hypothetical protein
MQRLLRFVVWVLAAIGMAVVVLCLVYFITLVIGPARFSGLTLWRHEELTQRSEWRRRRLAEVRLEFPRGRGGAVSGLRAM